MVDGHLNSK